MNFAQFSRPLGMVLVAAALSACTAKETPAPSVRPVQLWQIRQGGVVDTAVFAGEVKPRHEADLSFRINGKVVERLVDIGARVKKGDVLARLDPSDVGLQAVAAKASVAAAETEFRFAEAEYHRYEGLLREKFISASALDAKRNARDANRAKFEQAQANLAVAQNQATYASLVATENGVITAVNIEPGQVVTPAQVVMKLAREDQREVAISVPENRIGELKDGRKLIVSLWANPQKTYAAAVREIAPAVDPVTRTFAVRVAIANPDAGVEWGMTANVGVLGAAPANAAMIPLTAIYQLAGKPAVWRFDPVTNAVNLQPVTVAQYHEDGALVTSGVANGDWIVAAGVHKLLPGQIVRPYADGPDSAANPPAVAPARS
jgi:multidrug efflux system membrane fusion protein